MTAAAILGGIAGTLALALAALGIGHHHLLRRLAIARTRRTEMRVERDEARAALAETTDVLVARNATIRRLGVELAKADTTIREYEDRVNRQRERPRKARAAGDERQPATAATPLPSDIRRVIETAESFLRQGGGR